MSVGIIGAGISGLACARELVAKGLQVTILEKSRSYGGRCASKSWKGHSVDHGAQYFTMSDESFAGVVRTTLGEELQTLTAPILDELGQVVPTKNRHRYYHGRGNRFLGLQFAEGLDVRHETLVEELNCKTSKIEMGGEFFDAVVSSLPTPQLAQLLGWMDSPVKYVPCLTVLFEYEGAWLGNSRDQYAISSMDETQNVMWSACENHKTSRIQGDSTVFVVHASESFSARHLDTEPAQYITLLQKDLEQKWKLPSSKFKDQLLHRWRYARPAASAPAAFPPLPRGLFLSGDGTTKARIENVWLSGVQAAGKVLSFLNPS